jgi:parallel beta-helix repeat protein
MELTNVTVSGNSSTADGGGLQVEADAVLVLTNVTVSGNSARGDGGGIALFDTASGTLNNLTITGNVADTNTNGDEGGGIASLGGALSVRNTIVGGNTDMTPALDAPDCSGALSSAGHNLIGNGANCGIAAGPGDQIGTPAAPVASLLGPLAANGGPTQTHALLPGSPAIDSGGTDCAVGDQRGAPRGDCDIGAYEVVRCLGRLVNQIGTEADDTLIGSPGPDGGLGLSGKDRLSGRAGADGLCGGSGRDTLKGGGGRDRLNGEDGRDLCIGGGGRDKAKRCERERTIP